MRASLCLYAALLAWLPASARTGAEAPALQRVADELGAQLAARLQAETLDAPVVALVVAGDASVLGQAGRLAQELERLLVFRLSARPAVLRVEPVSAEAGEAGLERARAAGASWVLRCAVGTSGAKLVATCDLVPLHTPFWDRLVDPLPRGALHHVFAGAEIDDEVRLLLGLTRAPPPLGSWHLEEVLVVPRRILDAGLGDLDGVSGGELVVLYEDALEVFSLQTGRARRLTTYGLGGVPAEPVRTRDPSGSLVVVDFNRDGRYEVLFKLFGRRWGELLTWSGAKLVPIRRLARLPLCLVQLERRPTLLTAVPEAGTNRLAPELELADINSEAGRALTLPGPFVALRCHQAEDGSLTIALVDGARAVQRLSLGGQLEPVTADAGAGMALVDLDMDGDPESVLSEPVWPGEPDGVRVLASVRGGGQPLWRSRDIIGSIVAISGGDPRGDGKQQAVLVSVEPGGQASRVYLLGR
ncbi:MAG TPA: hypothetical protein PK668_24515 [Myxococcota bacterium]|nr:hypothetical protein [Myxococcota bacterium]HRY95424.1 hypothetical protein [Myxococcota bacterium]HSA21862.1 hypothetical protein [Myxococcota bacterium]